MLEGLEAVLEPFSPVTGCVFLEAHPHVGFTGNYPRDAVAALGQNTDIVRGASAFTRPLAEPREHLGPGCPASVREAVHSSLSGYCPARASAPVHG